MYMQIIAGLKKHVAQLDLEGSLVVVITNLRTAKLAVRPSVHLQGASQRG